MRKECISTATSSDVTTESLSTMLTDAADEGRYLDIDECVKHIQSKLKHAGDNSELITFTLYDIEMDYVLGTVIVYSDGSEINAVCIGRGASKSLALDIINGIC